MKSTTKVLSGILLLLMASVTISTGQTSAAIDKKVNMLLAKMTLEEKAGQMMAITLGIVSGKGADLIDEAKLKEAILKYHVGSIINVNTVALSRAQWFQVVSAIQKETANDRLHIPVVYAIDAVHGENYTEGSTLFPQEIAMAATFNPELVKEAAAITAYETRASYIPWNYSPIINLGKNPLWPRLYETFGEDPYLVRTMGAAVIGGAQGSNIGDQYHVAATMKHFLGYGNPVSGKDRTTSWIPDSYMREYFLPAYAAAIRAGAKTLMVSSGDMNGVPVHSSKYLLTDVLRGELHFSGIAISDWKDIQYLHDRSHIAETQKEAVRIAVNAGIDMTETPFDFTFAGYLVDLVKEGKVSLARVDEAVKRILKVKFELGLFERPVGNPDDYPKFGSEEFRQVSLKAATEAITLLKNNDHILPFSKDVKLLVTGPTANTMQSLDGGWSYNWQGDLADKYATGKHTILQAIQQKIGTANVTYVQGAAFDSLSSVKDAVNAARNADAILVCLGELSYAENPGNINDLNLPEAQTQLVRELAMAGKPIVLVLAEGRPRIVSEAESLSAATLMIYYTGNEGGDALVNILFGDDNPSGKLPITYPRAANSLMNYYRKLTENANSEDKEGYHPLYEFGYGLSYTTFSYSNLKISKPDLRDGDTLLVSVDLKNTGNVQGKETALLYTSEQYASVMPDTKRLRAFDKISLKPGETKTISFKLTPADLAFVNDLSKTVTEAGEFKIMVGDQQTSFRYISNSIPSRTQRL